MVCSLTVPSAYSKEIVCGCNAKTFLEIRNSGPKGPIRGMTIKGNKFRFGDWRVISEDGTASVDVLDEKLRKIETVVIYRKKLGGESALAAIREYEKNELSDFDVYRYFSDRTAAPEGFHARLVEFREGRVLLSYHLLVANDTSLWDLLLDRNNSRLLKLIVPTADADAKFTIRKVDNSTETNKESRDRVSEVLRRYREFYEKEDSADFRKSSGADKASLDGVKGGLRHKENMFKITNRFAHKETFLSKRIEVEWAQDLSPCIIRAPFIDVSHEPARMYRGVVDYVSTASYRNYLYANKGRAYKVAGLPILDRERTEVRIGDIMVIRDRQISMPSEVRYMQNFFSFANGDRIWCINGPNYIFNTDDNDNVLAAIEKDVATFTKQLVVPSSK